MPPSRIDELRRRVQNDPASIAFAQLAEEYRRAGQTDEAVRICREGLTRHPGYLSARVTLGRALLDLGHLGEARGEFEFVVAEAPENLAAVRGLAEISHREGQTADALTYYQRALALSRHDPEIEEIVQQLSRQMGASSSGDSHGLSFEEAHQELLSAAERVPLARPAPAPEASASAPAEGPTAPFDFDRLVAALGSPSAPPQFEAAVDGRAGAAPITLPEPVDLGPNPFAALEAELRAAEAAAPVESRPRPWEPSDAAPVTEPAVDAAGDALAAQSSPDLSVAGDAAGPAADRPAADVPDSAWPPGSDAFGLAAPVAGDAFGVAAPVADDAFGLVAPVADDAFDLGAVPVADAEPSAIDALLAAPEPPAPAPSADLLTLENVTPAAPPTAEAAAAAPAPAGDDVLGDLESWLSTLQNRATD